MRTIVTRSAQKKNLVGPLERSKPISKEPRTRQAKAAASANLSAASSKSAGSAQPRPRGRPPRAAAAAVQKTMRPVGRPKLSSPVSNKKRMPLPKVNPEATSEDCDGKDLSPTDESAARLLEVDMQSQQSTSMETQSRCGDLESLPSLHTEFESLTSLVASPSTPTTESDNLDKINRTQIKSEPLQNKRWSADSQQTDKPKKSEIPLPQSSPLQLVQPVPLPARAQPEQASVRAAPVIAPSQPPLHNSVEETIDELERRVIREGERYQRLVANQPVYQTYMPEFDYQVMMMQASIRLINFDPNFDASSTPLPWELLQAQFQSHEAAAVTYAQPVAAPEPVFAEPRPRMGPRF